MAVPSEILKKRRPIKQVECKRHVKSDSLVNVSILAACIMGTSAPIPRCTQPAATRSLAPPAPETISITSINITVPTSSASLSSLLVLHVPRTTTGVHPPPLPFLHPSSPHCNTFHVPFASTAHLQQRQQRQPAIRDSHKSAGGFAPAGRSIRKLSSSELSVSS